MSYSDYGAMVYKNGERRRDKEDVALFASDEETFGVSSENIGSGARIWVHLLHKIGEGMDYAWIDHIHHGIMGDGSIRVLCHKQGLPQIYEQIDGDVKEIEYASKDVDRYEYGSVTFDYKGYHFVFISNKPYEAYMTEPDGTKWECFYDYEYGAGFENEND